MWVNHVNSIEMLNEVLRKFLFLCLSVALDAVFCAGQVLKHTFN